MATYTTECVAGHNYKFAVGVFDASDVTGRVAKINPTIDPFNDFLLSVNDGPWEAFDVAPVVSPALSEFVNITFSVDETTAAGVGGFIKLWATDTTDPAEWIGGVVRFNGVVAAPSTLTAAQVNAEVDQALADYDAPTKAELDSAVAPLAPEIAAIKAVTDALPDAGALTTISDNVAAILLDTGTDGVVVAAGSKSGYSLAADQSGVTVGALNAFGGAASTAITALATSIAALNTKLGSPANATASNDIASIQAVVDAINATLVTTGITVLSAINGDEIEMYRSDTWKFTATVTGLTLTDYEAIAFVVKKTTNQPDDDAVLYVRSDAGLLYLAGEVATAGDGTITIDSATQFSVNIKITATDVTPGKYTWALKCFDTTPATDEGYTRAVGKYTIKDHWLRATA
jgi:hypothetical protein